MNESYKQKKIPKKYLEPENCDKAWFDFVNLCIKLKGSKEFNTFFELFLTFEERKTIISRYQIIQALLTEDLTQREIAKKYKVSIAQITRGSNALKIIDPEFKKFLVRKAKMGS